MRGGCVVVSSFVNTTCLLRGRVQVVVECSARRADGSCGWRGGGGAQHGTA